MDLFSVMLGAITVLILHEWAEWRVRVNDKRRSCHHSFDHISEYAGYRKRHCSKCGAQEFIEEDV